MCSSHGNPTLLQIHTYSGTKFFFLKDESNPEYYSVGVSSSKESAGKAVFRDSSLVRTVNDIAAAAVVLATGEKRSRSHAVAQG